MDCRAFLNDYGDFDLGVVEVGKIQLCSRGELELGGKRMARKLWGQTHKAHFASEAEILLMPTNQ